eukprot:SAG31_NODE_1477_length_8194_cov_21.653490_3_plen_71_part_00
MDMCILPPPNTEVAKHMRPAIIEQIAATLEHELGMSEVNARSTARIPIVMFEDPATVRAASRNSLALFTL